MTIDQLDDRIIEAELLERGKERERCAKIAENTYTNDMGQIGPRPTIQQAIAAAIRNKE